MKQYYFVEDVSDVADAVVKVKNGYYFAKICGRVEEWFSIDAALLIRKVVCLIADRFGGGIVYLKPGVYLLQSSEAVEGRLYRAAIQLDNFVILRGSGKSTILKLGDSVGGNVIAVENKTGVGIEKLKIDGNKAKQVDSGIDGDLCGIRMYACVECFVKDVEIVNCKREGFYSTNCGWCHFENITAKYCDRTGIELDSPDYCQIINVKALYNELNGVDFVGGATREELTSKIIGGFAYGNKMFGLRIVHAIGGEVIGFTTRNNGGMPNARYDGIFVDECEGTRLIGCYSLENYRCGIYLYNSERVEVLSCCTLNNNEAGYSDGHGIRLYNCTHCVIKGNLAYDNRSTKKQQYGISEEGSSDYNIIVNNIVSPNAVGGVSTVGTNTINQNNI